MDSYNIKITRDKSGTVKIRRDNNGFNGFEILGFLHLCEHEVKMDLQGHGIKEGTKIITEREVKTKKT